MKKCPEKDHAIAIGLPTYNTGKPCKHGHLSDRNTKTSVCIECRRIQTSDRRINNPEAYKAYQKAWKTANRLKVNEDMRAWAHKNRDKIRAKYTKYYANNRDKVNDLAEHNRLKRLKRVPTWLSKEDRQSIRKVYALARELTAAYGFPWEVDHVIPLRGKTVSGLHVPSNLQIMPKSENRRKSNYYTERGL